MKAIALFVSHNPIRLIDLSSNRIGPSGCLSLISPLSASCPNLTSLTLAHNPIGDEGVQSICSQLLLRHRSLRHLDLSHTSLSSVAALFLSKSLSSPLCSLHSLSLSHNPIGEGVISIAMSVQNNSASQLASLNIADCDSDDAAAHHLLIMLANNAALTQLDCSGNAAVSSKLHARIHAAMERRERHKRIAIQALKQHLPDLTHAEIESLIARMKASILSQGVQDFCCELSVLCMQYYAQLDTHVQQRLTEIVGAGNSRSSHRQEMMTQPMPIPSAAAAGDPSRSRDGSMDGPDSRPMSLEDSPVGSAEQDGMDDGDSYAAVPVRVRKRKGSQARREARQRQQQQTPPTSSLSVAAVTPTPATPANDKDKKKERRNSGSGSKLKALLSSKKDKDKKSAASSSSTAAAPTSSLELDPQSPSASDIPLHSLPQHFRLWSYLQHFPTVVRRQVDSVQRGMDEAQGISREPRMARTKTVASSASDSAILTSSTTVTADQSNCNDSPPIESASLWDSYQSLQMLVGVLLLRADKAAAAARARSQLDGMLAKKRPPVGLAQRLNAQRLHATLPASFTQPNVYPTTTLLFESDFVSQLADSFCVLQHLSIRVRQYLLVQLSRIMTLLREDDLETMQQVLQIINLEIDAGGMGMAGATPRSHNTAGTSASSRSSGTSHSQGADGNLRLLDELHMAKQWTKLPALLIESGFDSLGGSDGMSDDNDADGVIGSSTHSDSSVPVRRRFSSVGQQRCPTLLRQIYHALESSIADRFDALLLSQGVSLSAGSGNGQQYDHKADAGMAKQFRKMELDEMDQDEIDKLTPRTRDEIKKHNRRTGSGTASVAPVDSPGHSLSTSNSGAGSVVGSGEHTRPPVGPLLDCLRRLVEDLKLLKHKVSPLLIRNRREVAARRREREATITAPPPLSSSPSQTSSLPISSFDLFSFSFERVHQRVIHAMLGERFRPPSALSLTDLMSGVGFLSWYASTIRDLLKLEVRTEDMMKDGRVASAIGGQMRSTHASLLSAQDYARELGLYSDELLSEWVTRQSEKATSWWRNMHAAEIASTPDLIPDSEFPGAGTDGDDSNSSFHSSSKQARSFYATNAPQDLFTRLNGFVDLALDEWKLSGRPLYRIGAMLVSMTRFKIDLTLEYVANLGNRSREFQRLVIANPGVDLSKDGGASANANAGSSSASGSRDDMGWGSNGSSGSVSANSSGVHALATYGQLEHKDFGAETLISRLPSFTKSQLTKLVESIPVRKGCVHKRTNERDAQRRKQQEKKQKEILEKNKHESLPRSDTFNFFIDAPPPSSSAAESRDSSMSSSTSNDPFSPRPLEVLRPTLISLVAQTTNADLYTHHADAMADQILERMEDQIEMLEEEAEMDGDTTATDAAAASNLDGDEGSMDDANPLIAARACHTQLLSRFDELSEIFFELRLACIDAFVSIALDRVVGIFVQWWSESAIKKRASEEKKLIKKGEHVPAYASSGTLMRSVLSNCSSYLAFVLPLLRNNSTATLLLKKLAHGLVVHSLAFLLTAPKSYLSSAPGPGPGEKRLQDVLAQVRGDMKLLRAFFGVQPAMTSSAKSRGRQTLSETHTRASVGSNPFAGDAAAAADSFSLANARHRANAVDVDEEENNESGYDSDSFDSAPSSSSGVSFRPISALDSRQLVSASDLEGCFEMMHVVEALLMESERNIPLQFAQLTKRFPLSSRSYRSYGLHCVSVLQGCFRFRPDLDSKVRHALIHALLDYLQDEASEGAGVAEAKAKAAAAAAAAVRTGMDQHDHERDGNESGNHPFRTRRASMDSNRGEEKKWKRKLRQTLANHRENDECVIC